ncbi:MAG: cysteine--tRNA ligase [Candidatus Sumerlaeaceae bacterium]|nr:cysteine--tRNA ligase [Candidatus Sumerlaeaceae bacterium]
MMTIQIYNTATRQKEIFEPINPPVILMYNCGPTVYDYFHIGNARNFVVADTVRRYLEFVGYRVRFVQNFTDIDEKIIRRAHETGEPWDKLAERFIEEYFRAADALGIQRATVHPRATEHIPQMITLVERLIARGLAYVVQGNVYFRVRHFPAYGELSGKNIDELEEGARVEVEEHKEDPLDFALWKAAKPGEPSWPSPWGPGRPGWHIECSAMALTHLGETIDIHSGGCDLIFPHHENERAQSMGASGKPFVRYWLHNGFLTIDKEKMSKSLGNFFTINEVLAKYPPSVVRFYLLSAHYRHPLDYSDAALEESRSAVGRIREAVISAEKLFELMDPAIAPPSEAEPSTEVARFETAFCDAMSDDFNTPRAIAAIFEAVADLNAWRLKLVQDPRNPALAADVAGLINLIHRLLAVLGLDDLIFGDSKQEHVEERQLAHELIDILIRTRQKARELKQFTLADFIREELSKLNIRLQDLPTGTIWIKD